MRRATTRGDDKAWSALGLRTGLVLTGEPANMAYRLRVGLDHRGAGITNDRGTSILGDLREQGYGIAGCLPIVEETRGISAARPVATTTYPRMAPRRTMTRLIGGSCSHRQTWHVSASSALPMACMVLASPFLAVEPGRRRGTQHLVRVTEGRTAPAPDMWRSEARCRE